MLYEEHILVSDEINRMLKELWTIIAELKKLAESQSQTPKS